MSTQPPDTAPHTSAAASAEVVIRGGRGWPTLEGLREVFLYRTVFYALVRRGITTRYRQSVGGVLWILAGPLSSAATYSVFLGGVAKVQGDKGTDYILFALVGTVTWGIFLRGGIGATAALTGNAAFVKKVYFPRVMLPLSFVGQSLADLAPATGMMFVVALSVGESPTWRWILLLIPYFVVMLFSAAFAMVVSAINVYARDLSYSSSLITQFGMFASAVVYPLSGLGRWERTYGVLNPLAGSIDTARAVVYRGDPIDIPLVLGGLAWTVVLMLFSFLIFSMLERNAADRI
jgi:lipopolysaccharide transport system permease protein